MADVSTKPDPDQKASDLMPPPSSSLKQPQPRSLALSSATQARERAASVSGSDEVPTSTATKQRKRLSINFSLPVVPSSGSGNAVPPSMTGSSSTITGSRRARPSHTHSASVSLPPMSNMMFSGSPSTTSLSRHPSTTSPNSNPSTAGNQHRHSVSISNPANDQSPSNSSTASANSPNANPAPSNKASAIEYYFSQLAYRERRVVELRDEIKRMELQLRQAEDDLTEFRKQVPSELMPGGGSALGSGGMSTPRTSLSRSNTLNSGSGTTISPPIAVARGNNGLVPFASDSAPSVKNLPGPNGVPTSLADLSMEGRGDIKNGLLGGGLPAPPSRNQHQKSNPAASISPADLDSAQNNGQYWSFLENMKGAQTNNSDLDNSFPLGTVPPSTSGLPATTNMAPPPSGGMDNGLPDLALLQQQHQTQLQTGQNRAPMAPPRRPRRRMHQSTSDISFGPTPNAPFSLPPNYNGPQYNTNNYNNYSNNNQNTPGHGVPTLKPAPTRRNYGNSHNNNSNNNGGSSAGAMRGPLLGTTAVQNQQHPHSHHGHGHGHPGPRKGQEQSPW